MQHLNPEAEMVRVKLRFVNDTEDMFLSNEAYFEGSFFHARDASTGIMHSWPGSSLAVVQSERVKPAPQPQVPIRRAAGNAVAASRQDHPKNYGRQAPMPQQVMDEADWDEAGELPPIPPGATRVTDPQALMSAVRLPPAAPNLGALGASEMNENEVTAMDPIRQTLRMRRMRTQGEGY